MTMLNAALVVLAASSAGATTDASATGDGQDKIRCVRENVIGSIAQTKKVCHTLREWDKLREVAQEDTRRITTSGPTTTPQ